jgi:phosphodiesterase/alkaline phosphatase D-like protein
MLTRRTLLRFAAVSVPVVLTGCGGGSDEEIVVFPEDLPESVQRFPRTPIAGDMTDTRVVLVFHVADDSPVTLHVWNDAGVVVDQAIDSSGDGFHKVMIDDLKPGTAYQYAVFTSEDRSLICQFRTAPSEGDLSPVTFALLACVGQGTILPDYFMPGNMPVPTVEPFQWEIFTHLDTEPIDAFVHLGDQGYFDFVWSEEGGEVDAYLHAWGFYHGGGYRDVYSKAGLYATWDDHESIDNGSVDPWDMSAEDSVKMANAHEAWFKVVPIDAMAPGDAPVWRGFRWGHTVELLLLDCRYELTDAQLVSPEQLQWLVDRIAASPCRFICVATPKPFTQITTSQQLMSDNADRWETFPDQRAAVSDLLDAEGLNNVVFVTGDIHMNYLGRANIEASTVSESVWEICCTSGNYSPLASGLSTEQFDFVSPDPHVPVLTFDPASDYVHVAFYGVDGSVAFEQTLTDV